MDERMKRNALIVGAIVLALLSIGAGALIALTSKDDRAQTTSPSPSSTPSQTSEPSGSSEPSASQTPEPSGSESPVLEDGHHFVYVETAFRRANGSGACASILRTSTREPRAGCGGRTWRRGRRRLLHRERQPAAADAAPRRRGGRGVRPGRATAVSSNRGTSTRGSRPSWRPTKPITPARTSRGGSPSKAARSRGSKSSICRSQILVRSRCTRPPEGRSTRPRRRPRRWLRT